ncbi:MAG: RNA-binding S4 domain-containing protein, partial [Paramuribaculum sp.]|nr:RNA-binding S4 domain-containing protein [Paramuribaculum sp.]
RMVKPGDIVKVRKPPVTYSFRVDAITQNRHGAKLVPEYMTNVTPESELHLLDVVRLSGFIDRRKGLGRPTKREGRDLQRFTDQASADSMGWDFDFDDDFLLNDDDDQ